MVAVSTSAVDPLPHQIRAVYGELLPRTLLRFLLPDDPGLGDYESPFVNIQTCLRGRRLRTSTSSWL